MPYISKRPWSVVEEPGLLLGRGSVYFIQDPDGEEVAEVYERDDAEHIVNLVNGRA